MKDVVGDKAKYRVRPGFVFLNFKRQVLNGMEQRIYNPEDSIPAGGKILATMEDLEGQVHKVTRIHPIWVYCQKCGKKFETIEPLPQNAACPTCKIIGADVNKKRRRVDADPVKDRIDREDGENRANTTGEPGVEVLPEDQEPKEETKATKTDGMLEVRCNDCGHEFEAKPGKGGLKYVHCSECKKRGVELVE